jgi:thiamine-phosphate pyrophosphorylase
MFEGGARLLQLRAKSLPGGRLLALAEQLVAAAEPFAATVIVNDRADIARLAQAGGVHVGQDDLPAAAARSILPSGEIGVSTHTMEQFDAALNGPATYIAVGPVFPTGSKDTGYEPIGLDFVARAAARSDRPVVAIGGITLERAPEVVGAGAASVAIISDLLAGDPRERTGALVAVLSANRQR